MQLSLPDDSGRKFPEPLIGSEEILDVDLIIEALGFVPEDIPKLFNCEDLAVSKWGTIKIDLRIVNYNSSGSRFMGTSQNFT